MMDLFGNEEPAKPRPHHGYKLTKYIRRYKRSNDKIRRCKTCIHLAYTNPNGKRYYKCKLIGITTSEATDIRLRDVCDLWDMEVGTVEQFEQWYDANFWDGNAVREKILGKVKELYENKDNNH